MKQKIQEIVKKAILTSQKAGDLGELEIQEIVAEHPTVEKFGDYTTNIAMVLGKVLKKNPMEIAEKIKEEIENFSAKGGPAFGWEKIEVAAPGYINFYLSQKYLSDIVAEINKQKEKFGSSSFGQEEKVQIEFISSNPTGPIHLGNGRGGPIGDALGNIFEKMGYKVEREFYVNDFGNQVEVLGHSILKDEEAQYSGDYVSDLANKLPETLKDPMEIGVWGANIILDEFIKPTCKKLGIKFDNWFSEKSLHVSGQVEAVIQLIREKELTYEKEGALWFKSTEFGDDKDRVIIKSDGKKTYLINDLAYHKNKLERGFDKLINIQGADHHKEAEVVKKFVEEILGGKNKLDGILSQFVRVLQDGKEVKMSKRRGVYFALDDLIDEVGKDAVRFIFTSYASSSHINFDINLAKERSEKNPVFYVQYAHARISSILRKAESFDLEIENLQLLTHEKEMSLIKELNKFPELVEEISQNYEVHRLPHYAIKLADKFHSFYNACKVLDSENPELSKARLALVSAVKIVLAETLRLIGVNAPEKM